MPIRHSERLNAGEVRYNVSARPFWDHYTTILQPGVTPRNQDQQDFADWREANTLWVAPVRGLITTPEGLNRVLDMVTARTKHLARNSGYIDAHRVLYYPRHWVPSYVDANPTTAVTPKQVMGLEVVALPCRQVLERLISDSNTPLSQRHKNLNQPPWTTDLAHGIERPELAALERWHHPYRAAFFDLLSKLPIVPRQRLAS